MTPVEIEKVLNHKYSRWDLGECTIRHYLVSLAHQCWIEEECFSGKRPFGNGGWYWDVYDALADGGFITGNREEDGGWTGLDIGNGNVIIQECFNYLKNPPPATTPADQLREHDLALLVKLDEQLDTIREKIGPLKDAALGLLHRRAT